jgi:hypothetical protein
MSWFRQRVTPIFLIGYLRVGENDFYLTIACTRVFLYYLGDTLYVSESWRQNHDSHSQQISVTTGTHIPTHLVILLCPHQTYPLLKYVLIFFFYYS